ncbi:hypothetical protein [Microbulbifer hainanensis]|uniref:hypothetical protein n=1 Tax=Microbulbifer hainanensis TaxID=2735675 RepID=UPI0018681EA2|nr:hypothetical protein [Microbulbifer hainanensis]
MRRLSGYPRWFYAALMIVVTALVASGILLLPNMIELRLDMDAPVHLSGSLRLASAAAHSFTAFLAIGVVGALATVHMRVGWNRKQNRKSGISLLALFFFLLASAVGIYYFGDMDLSRLSSLSHSLVGLVLVLLFAWHAVVGRRIRLQKRRGR